MKKRIALLLALALAICALSLPALADSALLSQNGIELRALNYEISSTASPFLQLYVYASNDTDTKTWISAKNATVNGVPVKSAGVTLDPYTEYGDGNQDIMFMTTDEDTAVSGAAISNPRQIEMDLVAMNSDTYEHLFEKHVSLDVLNLGDSNPAPSGGGNDSYVPDTGNTAPAYTPASYDFKTLKQGSKGQAVRDLQQRLTDLYYLNDKVDGSFGRNTCTAVRSFCEQNGLPIGSQATPEMQELLYSSSAKYYVEPYLPLMIAGSYIVETPLDLGLENGFLEVELVNRSPDTAIRGYVLSFYQTDMYGNRINLSPNGGELYHFEMEMMKYIEPGHYLNAKDAYPYVINKFYSTYAVYVGVKTVVMENGDVRDIDLDDVSYFECRVAN